MIINLFIIFTDKLAFVFFLGGIDSWIDRALQSVPSTPCLTAQSIQRGSQDEDKKAENECQGQCRLSR